MCIFRENPFAHKQNNYTFASIESNCSIQLRIFVNKVLFYFTPTIEGCFIMEGGRHEIKRRLHLNVPSA